MGTDRQPTEDRQRQIAQAALDLIAEEGLGRFTTAAIARRVGISEGAIFRHFPSKEAIVTAAIGRVEELFEGEPPPAGPDPIASLRAFMERRIATIQAHPGIGRLVFSDELAHAAGPEGAERIAALKKRSLETVRGYLARAKEQKLLPDGIDIDELLVIVQGAALALAVYGDKKKGPAQRAKGVWAVLERLIRRR